MLSRFVVVLSIMTLSCLHSGCAPFSAANTAMLDSMKVFKPRPHDYRDPADEVDPEWNMQKLSRGDRPMDTDHDPFARMITSPKARAIEQSLGVDYD